MYIPIPLAGAPHELGPGDVARYLKRIGAGEVADSPAGMLAHLHQRHLLSIPFENLDVVAGLPLRFDPPSLFEKLIQRKRGGICLELNLLFAWLLRRLKFTVTMLSGEMSIGWSHPLLLVEREGERFLCDVGYGCFFISPLPLRPGEIIEQRSGRFRIAGELDGDLGVERSVRGEWTRIVTFTLEPRSDEELIERLHRDLAAPGMELRTRRHVEIMLEDGRASLAGTTLEIVTRGERSVREIDEARAPHYLEHLFDIVL